ncbi:DUF1127 domain-containing protein [Sabulicella glaciei]|uniref:DUF1127 domain-containing protein n=1 Tax=Sabulicella glaciei TaxID=2984948 RepID=A0ABT3NS81_9PROT|nr:DUF1127 domain-containing protein [Roseococcus sp. MDT2-1-1]MCW8085025.1 DUF1127 domain-containing protein [Roseococcus sp. MDT2-1-1]
MNSITGHLATNHWTPALALFGAIQRRWRERRMAAALEALDDATLKDIGLFRGDIPSKVRERCMSTGGM